MAHFWFALDIGAYEDSTAHLTMLQDGAYNRLIRHYYKTARPIPEPTEQIVRISGAHSDEEIEAVTLVLQEFFLLRPDGWHNKRCDRELGKQREISKLRATLGRKGGLAKATAIATAIAKQKPEQLPPQLQSQLHKDIKSKPKSDARTNLTPRNAPGCQFVRPALAEVQTYCQERNNGVDAQKWLDHYSANGWKVGRVAMSDWRAAVRTWERNGYGENGQVSQTKQRQPSAAVARFANNDREIERAFGASASVGANHPSNGTGQAARLSSGDSFVLEGEVKKLP